MTSMGRRAGARLVLWLRARVGLVRRVPGRVRPARCRRGQRRRRHAGLRCHCARTASIVFDEEVGEGGGDRPLDLAAAALLWRALRVPFARRPSSVSDIESGAVFWSVQQGAS